jgi:hypothetical protein
MAGKGIFAQLIAQRFRLACERLDLNKRDFRLDCSQFKVPTRAGSQLSLF